MKASSGDAEWSVGKLCVCFRHWQGCCFLVREFADYNTLAGALQCTASLVSIISANFMTNTFGARVSCLLAWHTIDPPDRAIAIITLTLSSLHDPCRLIAEAEIRGLG